ncbi:MAG: non-canonical purine NTP pyrophosphatase [Paludibacteraceae bacterium]|nr:non-canonical purine NTP pyrophosphatase [Paludibacteraceae bacterium]
MRLVFASNNRHKLEEVRQIMPAGVEVLSLQEAGFFAEIEETGTTLAENSMIKARTVADFIQKKKANGLVANDQVVNDLKADELGVFADDTGLEIDALDGQPGVYTARWSGCTGNEQEVFAANRAKALEQLQGKKDRGAQFKTVVTLIRGNECIQVEGIVRGEIAEKEYGQGGFGYDLVFIPEGYDKTFAELPAEVKNTISHRARALAKLVEKLKSEK